MHVPALTAEELAACRKAFAQFDRDQSGTIDVRELKQVLDSMGQQLTDEALFAIVHEVRVSWARR
jgi:Ca2+-binding EF-hand superfamily protein